MGGHRHACLCPGQVLAVLGSPSPTSYPGAPPQPVLQWGNRGLATCPEAVTAGEPLTLPVSVSMFILCVKSGTVEP